MSELMHQVIFMPIPLFVKNFPQENFSLLSLLLPYFLQMLCHTDLCTLPSSPAFPRLILRDVRNISQATQSPTSNEKCHMRHILIVFLLTESLLPSVVLVNVLDYLTSNSRVLVQTRNAAVSIILQMQKRSAKNSQEAI